MLLLVLQLTLLPSVFSFRSITEAMAGSARLHSPAYDFDAVLDAPICGYRGKEYCVLADLYVKTVLRSVCGYLLMTPDFSFAHVDETVLKPRPFYFGRRLGGFGRPQYGLTMVGYKRLVNIHQELLRVIKENVKGDFLEAGVWRGGSSIAAKAVLSAYGGNDRKVHLVDSFQGLPAPRKSFQDKDTDEYSKLSHIRVSLEAVASNFERYSLLDSNVVFHKGFFNESLSKFRQENPDAQIAVLRMDGDMYESTTDILYNLYQFVPVRGTVIIDDWKLSTCRKAFDDFFSHHGISENVTQIDATSAYFIKKQHVQVDYQHYLNNFFQ